VSSRHKPNAVGVSNSDSSGSMTSDLPMNTPIAPSSVNPKASGSVLQGTRLATMDPRTGGDIYLFYQWEDSGLRYISQSPRRVWQGSTDLHVTDARAGTPLTSVSTGYNESTAVSIFRLSQYLAKQL